MNEPIELDADAQRFVAVVDGHECELRFTWHGEVASFDSVQVPKAVGGRGIAGHLTRHALDWARSQGHQMRPVCPYVQRWIQRHPDYADLVA